MQYLIERLSLENINEMQTLYRSVYSRTISMEWLVAKYAAKMFDVGWLGYLAMTTNKKAVAFYGVIPCHVKINEEIFLAAQSADTMTHRHHRKKGLFIQLAKKTYDLARQEGVQFIFGFPNENSYPGFIKLDWTFAEKPMQLFLLNGSKIPWAKFLFRTPILKSVYERLMQKHFNPVDGLAPLADGDGVMRDRLFIQHKNSYTKTFVIESDGILAWAKNDGLLKIGLLNFNDTQDPKMIEKFLQYTARRLGCHTIILMTSFNSPLYNMLIKIASPRDGLPIGFYNLTVRNLNFSDMKFEYCDIDIF